MTSSETATAAGLRRLLQSRMVGRDREEEHRVSTPLELLFDLCFVVSVSEAAAALHESLAVGHIRHAILGYLSVFFAIWWAWVNFTWFASAYDTDDIPYRLLTFAQIAGVLVLASGVRAAFDGNFQVVTVGYIIMRIALTAQWLRAAAGDRDGRRTALRYAVAVTVIQIGWIVRLVLPASWGWPTFFTFAVLEMLVPYWAEHTTRSTPWHPEHIAERYGLFYIIVLGECILSAFNAIHASLSVDGILAKPMLVAGGGLVIMFGLWWSYFKLDAEHMLRSHPQLAFAWGYGHYVLFASIAALGAGIAVAAQSLGRSLTAGEFALSERGAALAVGIPVASALLLMARLRALAHDGNRVADAVGYSVAALTVLTGLAANAIGLTAAVVTTAALVVVKVTVGIVTTRDTQSDEEVLAKVWPD